MFNFDCITKGNIKEHNLKWPEIPDHLYQVLIIGGSGSRKTITLLNLINNEPGIDKIYLYAKDSSEAKHHLLINKRKSTGLKYFNDSKTFIKYSIGVDGFYKKLKNTIQIKKQKIVIVFDDDCWYTW